MTEKKPKRPRDVSQLAKMIVDIASGETPEKLPKEKKSAAIARGTARMDSLSKEERKVLSSRAAKVRWAKTN